MQPWSRWFLSGQIGKKSETDHLRVLQPHHVLVFLDRDWRPDPYCNLEGGVALGWYVGYAHKLYNFFFFSLSGLALSQSVNQNLAYLNTEENAFSSLQCRTEMHKGSMKILEKIKYFASRGESPLNTGWHLPFFPRLIQRKKKILLAPPPSQPDSPPNDRHAHDLIPVH